MTDFRLLCSPSLHAGRRRPASLVCVVLTVFAAAVVSAGRAQLHACPFCPPATRTLNERLTQSDVALLTQWVSARQTEGETGGTTTYEVVQVARDASDSFPRGKRLTLDKHRPGKPGDLFLLTGTYSGEVTWDLPLEVTETSYQYIVQSPSAEASADERLGYYLKFLEFPDETIASDAFAEFAKAPYPDVAELKQQFPVKKLREWVFGDSIIPVRRGLYGMMLGLCGNEQDARRMRELIALPTDEFRLGIDGVMGGFMLLEGAEALDVIDQTKLKNEDAAFSETYAAMQALRFMWSYGEERIPKERLRASMRLLLDRPDLAEIVITDLARWEDWSIQDRLMSLFDKKDYDNRFTQRAIAAFMLVSVQSNSQVDEDGNVPEHVKKGREYVEALRQKAPKIVREAERIVLLQ